MDSCHKSYRPNRAYKEKTTKVFAVAGNPVLHSMSPQMFNAAFKACGFDAVYTRIAASEAGEIMTTVKETGISGINVTAPFKEEIMGFIDDVEEGAKKIGAVNTIVMKKGKYKGLNTDLAGVVNAFSAAGVSLSGRRAAVIGAGGAARAAALALLSEGAEPVIFNRTIEKAKVLAESMGCRASGLEHIGCELEGMDIIVSCLPVSDRIIDPRLLKKGMAVLDANYSVESSLVKDARKMGCRIIDGREWLLYQGAAAFSHFTGVEPPLPVMRRALAAGRPFRKRHIALVGFMGAGKSTTARGISKKAGMPLLDTDNEIEQKTGLSIREIFEKKGEDAFRKLERSEVAHIRDISHAVISCGGGTVLSKRNRDLLRKNCIVVWLWAGIDTLLERVGKNGARPLLHGGRNKQAVRKLLNERLPLYADASDMLVRTDRSGPDEVVRKVYEENNKFF